VRLSKLARLGPWPVAVPVVAVIGGLTAWTMLPSHGPTALTPIGAPGVTTTVVTSATTTTAAASGLSAGAASSKVAISTQAVGLTVSPSVSSTTGSNIASSNASNSNGNGNTGNGNTITDSKVGQPILQAPGLKPGGPPATGSVTLSIQGSASAVTLGESNLVSKTCAQNGLGCSSGTGTGNLAADLILTVIDTTTSRTVYQGAFNGLGQPQPIQVCGSSSKTGCPTWANKESHTLTFSVSFPNTNADLYEGTSTSVEFDWTKV
jgi:hypothetical protein